MLRVKRPSDPVQQRVFNESRRSARPFLRLRRHQFVPGGSEEDRTQNLAERMQRNYFRSDFLERGRGLRLPWHWTLHLVSGRPKRTVRRKFSEAGEFHFQPRRKV